MVEGLADQELMGSTLNPQPSTAIGCFDRAKKLVSAAGLAPAITRSQAEHVAATLRAVAPANGWCRGLGSCGDRIGAPWSARLYRRLVDPKGRAPWGALLIELGGGGQRVTLKL